MHELKLYQPSLWDEGTNKSGGGLRGLARDCRARGKEDILQDQIFSLLK